MLENSVEETADGGSGEEDRRLRERLEEVDRSLQTPEDRDDSADDSLDRLEKKMEALQVSLRTLQKTREQLVDLNLEARRQPDPSLRRRVTELYQRWDRAYRRRSQQLARLRRTDSSEDEREEEDWSEPPGPEDAADREEPEPEPSAEGGGPEEARPEGGGSPEPAREEEKKKEPWLWWRVLRVAVPLQLALVVLFCAVRLLEPRCCDFVNNFGFSSSPQLRYVGGPPPV